MTSPTREHPLPAVEATSQPRRGIVGVSVDNSLPQEQAHSRMRICVKCPSCTNYAVINGHGHEYRNITTMLNPAYACSACTWAPHDEHDTPSQWTTWYQGRLRGTLLWAMNESHLAVLTKYLETQPNRRQLVQFDDTFLRLMQRMPQDITSGRNRNDVVSLLKKMGLTRPRGT